MNKNITDAQLLVKYLDYIKRNNANEIKDLILELYQAVYFGSITNQRLFEQKDVLEEIFNKHKYIVRVLREDIGLSFSEMNIYDKEFVHFIDSISKDSSSVTFYLEKAKILNELNINTIVFNRLNSSSIYTIPEHHNSDNLVSYKVDGKEIIICDSFANCVKKTYSDKPINYNINKDNFYGEGTVTSPYKLIPQQIQAEFDPTSEWQMAVEMGQNINQKKLYLSLSHPFEFDFLSFPTLEELENIEEPNDFKDCMKRVLSK